MMEVNSFQSDKIVPGPDYQKKGSRKEEMDGGYHAHAQQKPNDEVVEEDEDIDEEEDDGTEQDDDISGQAQKASPLTAQQRARHAITGRGVTLAMLLEDHVVEPGENNMSIDYLGQKFTADLLADGRIKWREEDKIFGSPSAWALHCKKIVNPTKKSGCGWASVRYKGKKLDVYKSSWVRQQKPTLSALALHSSDGLKDDEETEEESESKKIKLDTEEDTSDNDCDSSAMRPPSSISGNYNGGRRAIVKHCTLGRRSNTHDQTTMVEYHTFNQMGKIQPFNVRIKTNALIVMDLHCHLTGSEVVGYVGGKWDTTSQYLTIEQAFPCMCRHTDRENAVNVENQIRCNMEKLGLGLVGWYHSHPKSQPNTSLRDIESQMEYQLQLKGTETSYHPCLGVIISPYDAYCSSKESQMRAYWVMPPPEQRPLDYGVPMSMQYEISQNQSLAPDILAQVKLLVDFYKREADFINMKAQWMQTCTYLEKITASLKKKLPKMEAENIMVQIEKVLLNSVDIQ